MTVPRWLEWAREIQALAQTGLHYTQNEFQSQRYRRLLEISAEIVSENSNLEFTRTLDAFLAPIGYATPRIDVRGAVFHENRLLMVRERIDGGWTLPGGWADVGDVPSHAAEREVWEEAGFHVKAKKVIGVYDANRSGRLDIFHAFKIIFLCEIIDGEARSSNETSDVAFFRFDEIPETLSSERTMPRQIVDAYNSLNYPGSPTIFD